MKHLIVISGPTASGKTPLSVSLAKHFNTCVLSADSRQFYKELSIGTAKPTLREMDGVRHYFIDSHLLSNEVTAAKFEKEAMQVLTDEFRTNDYIILTGGSGMFIDALCNGLDKIPADSIIREKLNNELKSAGLDPLLDELEKMDPDYYNQVDRQNPMRIIRALEVIRITGGTYSSLRKSAPVNRPFSIHRYAIDLDRDTLYERINLRTDSMINAGLIEEVKSIIQYRQLTSMNTVGYKEIFSYLDGHISKEEAINLIKQNSRRYAKRQITWIKRHPETQWITWKENNSMKDEIIAHFSKSINLE